MIPVLTAAEMKEADRRTIEEVGLPGAVLMENAGAAVARVVRERFPAARRPVIVCGKGNNGGDGFVVARRLLDLGPRALLFGRRDDVRGDARAHLAAYERSGGSLTEVADAAAWPAARAEMQTADVLVDALFGTGLDRAPAGIAAEAIAELALRAQVGTPVVAVDLPSGLPSDAGNLPWPTVRATVTVTFAAPKHGHVLPPACDWVGELVVADIGITRSTLEASGPRLFLLEAADAASAFPRRDPASHKGAYGHLLIVAGSVGKTGAAVLAATAALRSGVGLVTVATPAPAVPLVAAARAELMTEPLPVGPSGDLAPEALARCLALAEARDAVALGPGLGQDLATRAFIREFVRRCPVPLLVDADGLNALSPRADDPKGALDALRRSVATVLTPHPGEMARLIGRTTAEIQAGRLEMARDLSCGTGAIVVLKGQRTLVGRADGTAAVNPTGNPGMATGGTGDVLAGVIGALLARHDAWTAATAGVYLHGLAGDRAAGRLGQESLLAGDVAEALPEAIRSVGERPSASG